MAQIDERFDTADAFTFTAIYNIAKRHGIIIKDIDFETLKKEVNEINSLHNRV